MSDKDWENVAVLALSGLAWAVGRFEGMEQDPGYAGQVLAHLQTPTVVVSSAEAERVTSEAQEGCKP